MAKFLVIPSGSLLTITTGEYSAYRIEGVFRAAMDIHADDLLKEWLSMHPEQRNSSRFSESDFLGWVSRRGLLEPVDSYEWALTGSSSAHSYLEPHESGGVRDADGNRFRRVYPTALYVTKTGDAAEGDEDASTAGIYDAG